MNGLLTAGTDSFTYTPFKCGASNKQVHDAGYHAVGILIDLATLAICVDDIIKAVKASRAAIKGTVKIINPNEIRFSQSSVNGAKEITESMKAKGWVGDPIDVVKMSDGKFTTVDNTRVLAARNAGIDVKANVHAASDPIPSDVAVRFKSKNGQVRKHGVKL